MKRILVLLAVALFISGVLHAEKLMIELNTSYFMPGEQAFKDIYGSGPAFGAEISFSIVHGIDIWLEGSYFAKTGELSFTKEETKVRIIPVGGGIRFSLPLKKIFSVYGGAGLNYNLYKEENVLGEVSKGSLGFVFKGGVLVSMLKMMAVDAFVGYSYSKMNPADFKVNIGGFKVGLGLGFRF